MRIVEVTYNEIQKDFIFKEVIQPGIMVLVREPDTNYIVTVKKTSYRDAKEKAQ